ncbi:MAG: hypothetical protein NC933_03460, partial [Candidatus Omnitrophica bacterium]|nr:hypothetical protein [Candidatus Omnitrophota bacterium]
MTQAATRASSLRAFTYQRLASTRSALDAASRAVSAATYVYKMAKADSAYGARKTNEATIARFYNAVIEAENRLTAAEELYNCVLRSFNEAIQKENLAVTRKATVEDALSTANLMCERFASHLSGEDIDMLKIAAARQDIPFVDVIYDSFGGIVSVTNAEGAEIRYRNGLVETFLAGGDKTVFTYAISALGNISQIEVDREGIKRIYDSYGKLERLSLNDAAEVVYENGKVSQIRKSDGTTIRNMTFRESGELDGALISYPDGSMALYDDEHLLRIIGASAETVDYESGKIRKITFSDGKVYDWDYGTGGVVIITDNSRRQKRTYLEGRLIQLEELAGVMLTTKYYYDDTSNLIRSEICKGSDILYVYTYTYENGLTVIRDEDGNSQAYTKEKKLSYLIDSKGRKYSYTYVGKKEGYIEVYFPSGSKARYDERGDIIDIKDPDGILIKDIVLGPDNALQDFTYIKDSATFTVADGRIKKAVFQDGHAAEYYDNGFLKSLTTQEGDLTEYQYFVKDIKRLNDASTFLGGTLNHLSVYNTGSAAFLRLSEGTLRYGTGLDGAKRVSADETLAAGTYNFTSLTIDAGKTLKVASGTTINVLGAVTVNGSIFCGGELKINAYELNVGTSGAITGSVNIKCNTINNAGRITGNACLTGVRSGGNDTVRDNDFGTFLSNDYWGDSDNVVVSFPACDIGIARYRISGQGFGLTSWASVYICVNGSWVNLGSYTSPTWGYADTGIVENATGWSNVTGMMIQGVSSNGNCVSSSYCLHEIQAIIGKPTIEYAYGSVGSVSPDA